MVAGAPEALLADGTLSEATFDVVCALEVLEHVADDGAFVAACARLARAGGDVFLSTLNRTPLAAAASITIAEGALGLLPRGTHDAAKFRTPGDVAALLGAAGCRVRDARALHFAPAPRGPGAAWLGGARARRQLRRARDAGGVRAREAAPRAWSCGMRSFGPVVRSSWRPLAGPQRARLPRRRGRR